MEKKHKQKTGLWAILVPVNFEIRIAILLSAIGAISLIASLTLLSFTLSNILEETPIKIFDIEFDLFNTIIALAIITVIAFVTRLSAFIVSHLGAFRLEQILRTDLSFHLSKVPLGYIITTGSGALKKVMQEDVAALHAFVADSVPMIAKSIVAPITTLIILFVVDYRLALAGIFVLVIGASIMSMAMKDSQEYRIKYEKSQTDINKAVVEFAQAMPVVRTFDDGSESFKKYNDSLFSYRKNLNAWMAKTNKSAKFGTILLTPLTTLLAILLTGIYLLNNGSLELSSLILALFLSTGMADALMPVMWLSNFIKKSQASALRIQEIMDTEELPLAISNKTPDDISIHFENVSFSYDKTDKKALENISFVVPSKSTTAIVGPSGAGKSTVAKLIPRFWDVTQGSIKIGDTDIREISNDTLMDIVSFVFQDTFLFADSIFNNIKMANPNASDEDVVNAAKSAQIHDFILSLPNGYDTKAGERGANLSGGQKQRITIARTILRDNPIIILDEATAFADPENEEEIIKALANLMKDKTVIVIAHRLSTIKDVDQIIVIDEGKIKEIGKHQELLDNKQVYFNLWSNYEKAQEWNLETKEAL
ncbi:ABC transporter ATP-binding protein [Sulfurimonas sp.]|uniref:ABC transporter ATP-binding protein n=1 Tax=Sulfurimonas sp. TaxID=2022749 RepID=UPI002B49131F|nr:ABC transporter ATP-binding protein [Sulfurimonas sp.]